MNDEKSLSHQISETARALLSGELGIVEGCRQLTWLSSGLEQSDDLFLTIIAVDSETEDLPIGEARNLWNAEALARKEAEFEIYVNQIREVVLEACEALVRRYSTEE